MPSSGVAAPPRVQTSATGTAAVLVGEAVAHAYRLPSGELWFAESGEVVLSAGGRAAAVRQGPETLVVHTESERSVHTLPGAVAALAIADDGARAALLVAGRPARIEWWRLGAVACEAAVEVGEAVRGHVDGDEDLALVAAWTGTTAAAGARPAALLTSEGVVHRFQSPPAAVTVAGGRAWSAEEGGVTARTADGVELVLTGTLRDRIAVAPDHRHLLLYRAEHRDPAQMRLRILRTADGAELRAFDVEVDDDLDCAFVLTADLEVLAVAPDAGRVRVTALG